VAFAITEDPDDTARAYKAGANFVLEKPIHQERAMRSVRAALGLILRERRRYFRCQVDCPLTVQLSERDGFQLAIENVSEGGLAAIMPESVSRIPSSSVGISFKLPKSEHLIAGKANVVWTRSGKIGMQFSVLRPESRIELQRYLAQRFDESERIHSGRRANAMGGVR
jgi:hypothetical protein